MIEFDSQWTEGERFGRNEWPDAITKNEPMFFQMPLDKAYANGGPITRSFLNYELIDRGTTEPAFFDSRVHMLMPGWWPCIPGWHHDDVERSRADGQPNYWTASYRPTFDLGLAGSAVCSTDFVAGHFVLPEVEDGVIYKAWHPMIEAQVEADHNGTYACGVPYGRHILMDDRTLHQGTACLKGGWRWFGRITWGNPIKPAAELRRQTQVYLPHPMEGW